MALKVTICLGSSCFARGNKKTVMEIQEFIKSNKLGDKILFKGHHCFSDCNKGPVIEIDGELYEGIDGKKAKEIIKGKLQ